MSNQFSRREFLEKSALAGLGAAALGAEGVAAKSMPMRVPGKTGTRVSVLAFGCGSRLDMYRTEEAAVEAINLALDSGISYLAHPAFTSALTVAVSRVQVARRGARNF